VDYDSSDLENQLLPVLSHAVRDSLKPGWPKQMVDTCRKHLSKLFPFHANEIEFLNRLLDYGEIVPGLLTNDSELAGRIQAHPLLQWKALNVQRHNMSKPN
jgi:hypothetical protein